MTYLVSITRPAQKEINDLPVAEAARVRAAIAALAENPRPQGCIKLTDRDGWRIRVGSYRVIYEISDGQLLVTVIRVGNRRDIYR
jgi:mRNA interferase RelE/StbE